MGILFAVMFYLPGQALCKVQLASRVAAPGSSGNEQEHVCVDMCVLNTFATPNTHPLT